jgi:hypothetical protein
MNRPTMMVGLTRDSIVPQKNHEFVNLPVHMLPMLRTNIQARLEDKDAEDGDSTVTVAGTLGIEIKEA